MYTQNFRPSSFSVTNRVVFETPAINSLCRTQTVVDLHVHTTCSDGSSTPADIAAKARELGLGVAITDHNCIAGALEIARYADILSIPGMEVTSKEGAHLLTYFSERRALKQFYNKEIYPFRGREQMSSIGLSMEEIIRRARPYEPLLIFPHPYCAVYTGICNPLFSPARQQELLEMVDGVEVINAGNMKKWNLKCTVLGFNLNKAMTGGSDGHHLFQLGKAVTCASAGCDRLAFLEAIRTQKTRVIGKEVHLIRKVTGNGSRLPLNLKNSPDLMNKQMRYSYAVLSEKSRKVRSGMKRHLENRRLRKNGSLLFTQPGKR